MGYGIGDKPDNISKNDCLTGLSFNLWGNYTFANGEANPATTGREILLFFREVKKATETWDWLPALNSFAAAYGANFKPVAILYDSAGIIDGAWLNDELTLLTVNFTVIMDYNYLSSITKQFVDNFGASITNPFYYIVDKFCRIRAKTLGMPTDAVIQTYLTGPTITTVEPSTVTEYNTLTSVGVTFSEAVLHAADPLNYTFGGAASTPLPAGKHPSSVAADAVPNKYILTPGVAFVDGDLTIDISENITDSVFSTPVPVTDPGIIYQIDALPPKVESVRVNL